MAASAPRRAPPSPAGGVPRPDGPLRVRSRLLPTTLAAAVVPLLGAHLPPLPHDLVGLCVPAPALPVALVEVTGAPTLAVDAARAAGAREVWAAFPADDPRLGGATPAPDRLGLDPHGLARTWAGSPLPVPEALGGLLRVRDSALGTGLRLDGRDAVLVWADPATGLRDAAPGIGPPVDRGALVAVGLGVERTGLGLRRLPLPAAMALCGALAAAFTLGFRRLLPARALAFAGVATALVFVATVAARSQGVDLPVVGLAVAASLPGVVRVAAAAELALSVLDRVVVWLGAPGREEPVASGIDGRVRLLQAWLPGCRIDALPATRAAEEGEFVVPVRGSPGALRLRLGPEVPPEAEALVRRVAEGAAEPTGSTVRGVDPVELGAELARRAVGLAVSRQAQWAALLGDAGGVIGVFDPAGALVAGSARLRERLAPGPDAALLRALRGLSPRAVDGAARSVLLDGVSARLPGFGGELVLLPILGRDGPVGVLVHLVDAPHVTLSAERAVGELFDGQVPEALRRVLEGADVDLVPVPGHGVTVRVRGA